MMTPESGFSEGFALSLTMIIVSELGDKTFFIAAIMAMQHPYLVVYGGAVGALALMTVLSALMGGIVPQLLPKEYTHYAAALLFLVFGLQMLKEAREAYAEDNGDAPTELLEVEKELGAKAEDGSTEELDEAEQGQARPPPQTPLDWMAALRGTILVRAFTLTFLAEWGDRSQIATIALGADKDTLGVIVGATLGHAACTGLAVVGGKMLAARISEKVVLLVGGLLFLAFCVASLVQGPS